MFRVVLGKSHCKFIIKTLDLHKSIIKGEITKISSLMIENKKPQLKYNYDFEEHLESRVHSFFNLTLEIEAAHFSRKMNVLQLFPTSDIICGVKKKLYSLMSFLSGDLSDCLPISFSRDEIDIIKLSTKLYFNLSIGNFEILSEIFERLNLNIDHENIVLKLVEGRDLFTNLVDKKCCLRVEENLVYYKAKWSWDIYNVLEGNRFLKLGSIPLLKIEEK